MRSEQSCVVTVVRPYITPPTVYACTTLHHITYLLPIHTTHSVPSSPSPTLRLRMVRLRSGYTYEPHPPGTSTGVRIALAGPMGSGKTYVAEWLQRRYPSLHCKRIAFGDEVKDIVQRLWNPPKKDRARLVEFATGVRAMDPNVWINRMLATTEASPDANWICDDLRQSNEIHALRERGWLLVRILVPDEIRRERLVAKYPHDHDEHEAYAQHPTEQEVLRATPNLFACTIDTSSDRVWMDMLEKIMWERYGLRPTNASDEGERVSSSHASPDDTRTTTSNVFDCSEISYVALVCVLGLGCWHAMLHTIVAADDVHVYGHMDGGGEGSVLQWCTL